MQLQRDDRLGAYVILDLLGAGAMGEVYRAYDPKLERELAIKVLPDSVAENPELRSRFQREARVLGSLNHPNIATLHGFEQDGSTYFLVMEVVDGLTLEGRIAAAPIELEEVEEIFLQIADGLEAAHDNGVVHRDLKPANIKISKDGRVKLLDFGLAKTVPLASDIEAMADAPTKAIGEGAPSGGTVGGETREGTILGTAAYMAPEQARGQSVDARADIWAFGACLYEALSGQRAFNGQTATDILAAVLTKQPDPDALPKATPARLRQLLDRCLRKDRRQRLRSISDARLDLRDEESPWYLSTEETGGSSTALSWFVAAAVVAGIVLAALALEFGFREAAVEETPVTHVDITLPERWVLVQQNWPGPSLAMTKDGRTLVFAAQDAEGLSSLFVRSLDSPEPRLLAGTEGAAAPFFSPDGRWAGFSVDGRTNWLRKVAIDTGAVVSISELEDSYRGGSWFDNDNIVFATGSAFDLMRVPASGGRPEPFLIEGLEEQPVGFHPMADGRHFISRLERARETGSGGFRSTDGTRLGVIDSMTQRLVQTIQAPVISGDYRYSLSSHLLYASVTDASLMALPLNPDTFAIEGGPVPVLFPNSNYANGSSQYALASEGTLAYVERGRGFGVTANAALLVQGRGAEAELLTLSFDPGQFLTIALSPDGQQAMIMEAVGFERTVWKYDFALDALSVLLERRYEAPVWDPDGRSIVFMTIPDEDGHGIFRKSLVGAGEIEVVRRTEYASHPSGFSPDGRTLVYHVRTPTSVDIGLLDVGGTGAGRNSTEVTAETWLDTPARESDGALSPDGRWMAYLVDERLTISSFPDRSQVLGVTETAVRKPVWSGDGRTLYYAVRDEAIMAVPVAPGPELKVGAAVRVAVIDGLVTFDVARDSGKVVALHATRSEGASSFRVVLNWRNELERLAPHPQ